MHWSTTTRDLRPRLLDRARSVEARVVVVAILASARRRARRRHVGVAVRAVRRPAVAIRAAVGLEAADPVASAAALVGRPTAIVCALVVLFLRRRVVLAAEVHAGVGRARLERGEGRVERLEPELGRARVGLPRERDLPRRGEPAPQRLRERGCTEGGGGDAAHA